MPTGISKTVDEAGKFVSSLLSKLLPGEMVFHNLEHTREVVKATYGISGRLQLSTAQMEITLVAAWFHDSGFIVTYEDHVEESKRIAGQYLQEQGWEKRSIEHVKQCIDSTRMPQQANSLPEQILCDADLRHLASDDYPDYLRRLRKEWEWAFGRREPDEDWIRFNLEFLINHRYFTSYGQEHLQPGVDRNIKRLLDML